MRGQAGRTGLTDSDFVRALRAARERVRQVGAVTNRDLRTASGLNYDQAIKFFSKATRKGLLRRVGSGSGTHYVLGGAR